MDPNSKLKPGEILVTNQIVQKSEVKGNPSLSTSTMTDGKANGGGVGDGGGSGTGGKTPATYSWS